MRGEGRESTREVSVIGDKKLWPARTKFRLGRLKYLRVSELPTRWTRCSTRSTQKPGFKLDGSLHTSVFDFYRSRHAKIKSTLFDYGQTVCTSELVAPNFSLPSSPLSHLHCAHKL